VLRWGLAALVVAAAAGPAAAATTLRWKLKAGETLHYVMDQKTVSTATLNGQNLKTTVTQTIDMTWVVKDVDAGGTADITLTFDRLRTNIESPFAKFQYDSKENKAAEGPIEASLVPILKSLVGAPFSCRLSPQGVFSDVKLPESLAEKLRQAAPPGGAPAGPYSEEGLKKMISEASLILPKEELTPGKSWTQQIKNPAPGIGTMVLEKKYTYLGPDPKAGGAEKIGLVARVEVQPTPGSALTVKIKSQDNQGTFHFDNTAGRVTDADVAEKVEMVLGAMNQEVTQSTDSTTVMKLMRGGGSGK
jgi:hypothetical protein